MNNNLFDLIFDKTLIKEGGLSLDKADKGNYKNGELVGSKYGITPYILKSYRGKDVTAEDMQNLSVDEAKAIAKKEFFDNVRLNNIQDPDLAATVFDHEYNRGGRKGIKLLQKLAGVKQDGILGPQTLKALAEKNITAADYNNARREDYKSIGNKKFVQGWLNRVDSFDAPLVQPKMTSAEPVSYDELAGITGTGLENELLSTFT